ncbi:MAG: hypothetical protein Q9221_002303 [Calogaya cf. arnoldii]
MQSILQYCRLRRHIQAQYERDRGKAKAIGEGKEYDTSESSPHPSTTHAAGETSIEDTRNPEKGEQASDPVDSPREDLPVSAEHAFEAHHSMQRATTSDSQSAGMALTSNVATQGSLGTNLGTALTGINVRDRSTKEGRNDPSVPGCKVFVVSYEGDRDSLNPHNWSYGTRIWATVNIAFIGGIVGFASSVDSAALVQASEHFGVSEVAESLATGLFLVGFGTASIVFLQPETYVPILLRWKAAHLRSLTGDERYRTEVEIREDNIWLRLRRALYRPFTLTFHEPVIMLLALYLTVIYIILFTFFNGYTFIFTETYGFSEGPTGLSFIGIGIGLCLASLLVPFIYRFAKKDLAKIEAEGGTRLPPEFRLWFAMLGAPAIPPSLFWMGWTARPSVSYWSPLIASVFFGYGILCVFISSYQYIIDSYETYSASALASVTLIRYVAAGGSVEYAIPFYTNVGVPWTCTILGAISALCVPLPYLFFVFGPRVRKRSKYAVV